MGSARKDERVPFARNAFPAQPSHANRRHSRRRRYHTGWQPGAALQNTAICPAGYPPAPSAAAADRTPAEVHLRLHGVTADDIAAAIWQVREE
jgi:hypothetical protein